MRPAPELMKDGDELRATTPTITREDRRSGTRRSRGMACPACGLVVKVSPQDLGDRDEYCPRCLARSGGALSVELAPIERKEESKPLRGLLGRLVRRPW